MTSGNEIQHCLRAVLAAWLLAAIVSVFLLVFFVLYSPTMDRVAVEVGGNYTVTVHENGFSPFWTRSLGLSLEEDTLNTTLEDFVFYRAPCVDTRTVPQLLPSVSLTNVSFGSGRLGLNYHGSSVPVYSAAGGRLNYTFNATSTFDSARCFCLHLFDNSQAYLSFVDEGSTFGSIFNTGCLESGTNHIAVSLLVNVSSFYYVAATMNLKTPQPFLLNYSITPELQAYNTSLATGSTCAETHDQKDSSCVLPLSEHSSFIEPNTCVYCHSEIYTNLSVVTNRHVLNAGALLFLVLTLVFITFLALSCGAYVALTKYRQAPVTIGKVSSGFSWNLDQEKDSEILTPTIADEIGGVTVKAKSMCLPKYFHASFFSTTLGVNQKETDHMLMPSRTSHNSSTIPCFISRIPPSMYMQHLTSKTTTDYHKSSSEIPASISRHMPEITEDVFENVRVIKLTPSGIKYHFASHGVTIVIPKGAVKTNTELRFAAALVGPFQLPTGYRPVSAVVWVGISQTLLKPVQLRIPHCAKLKTELDCRKLCFVTASDESFFNTGVFHFQPNHSAQEFTVGYQYGAISLNHFCCNCIVERETFPESLEREYCITKLLPKHQREDQWKVYFCFSLFLPTCLKTLKDQYGDEYDNSESVVVSFSDKSGKARLKYSPHPSPHWMLVRVGLLNEISENAIDCWSLVGNLSVGDSERRKLLRQRLRLREQNKLYPPRLGLLVQHLSHAADLASEEESILRTTVTIEGVEPLVETELYSTGPLTIHSDTGRLFETSLSDTALKDVLMSCHGKLGEQWFVLGLHLGISPLELEQLEHSLPTDWDKCCRRMLMEWWEKCGDDGAACKEKVISALKKMERIDIAASIQFKHSCLVDECPNQPTISQLVEEVVAYTKCKWRLVGIQLLFTTSELDAIEMKRGRDPMRCYCDLLFAWKRGLRQPFTWETTVRVLESAGVGEKGLARQLKRKYCSHNSRPTCNSNTEILINK